METQTRPVETVVAPLGSSVPSSEYQLGPCPTVLRAWSSVMSGLEKPDELQETLESGPSRYAAFAMRLRTLITASSRCRSSSVYRLAACHIEIDILRPRHRLYVGYRRGIPSADESVCRSRCIRDIMGVHVSGAWDLCGIGTRLTITLSQPRRLWICGLSGTQGASGSRASSC